MNELKVTEGNWKVDKVEPDCLRIMAEWSPVAYIYRKDEEAVANAHMLKASKEMYEVLKLLEKCEQDRVQKSDDIMDNQGEHPPDRYMYNQAIEKCRQALAKAEAKDA